MSDAHSTQVPQPEQTNEEQFPENSPEAARRAVLKKLGVYGAFVAPALITALSSSASAQALIESGATN